MDIRATSLHYPCMNDVLHPVPDYRLYRERSGEAADFWLHCEPIPERSRLHRFEISAHRHPALFQMFRVSEGSGEIFDGAAWNAFAAPCVLFIPPGAVHGFRFASDVDGVVVTALADRLHGLAATDRRIAEFARAIRILPLAGSDDSLSRIAGEMSGAAAGRTAALEALVALAIVETARTWSGDGDASPASRDTARLEALQTLVAAHFRERRPLDFYAARLGLSGSHLNRLTRSATGGTVQALVEQRVLEAARRELVFTPTPVNRIAESLGFADPAYFNRFFSRRVGTTPGAFRDAERKRLTQ